jgi:hypothetical protein
LSGLQLTYPKKLTLRFIKINYRQARAVVVAASAAAAAGDGSCQFASHDADGLPH